MRFAKEVQELRNTQATFTNANLLGKTNITLGNALTMINNVMLAGVAATDAVAVSSTQWSAGMVARSAEGEDLL